MRGTTPFVCLVLAIGCADRSEPITGHHPFEPGDPRARLDPVLAAAPEEPAPDDDGEVVATRASRTVVRDLVARTTTRYDEPVLDGAIADRAPEPGLAPPEGMGVQGIRTTLIDTTAWPARLNVKLYARYPNGQRFSCSGGMIGDRFVLTAGHCIYNAGRGGWAEEVTVVPGLERDYMPFGDATAINLVSVTAYIDDGDKSADHAMITLDRRLGQTVGWFGLHAASDGQLDNDGLVMNGYPAESYPGNLQVGVTGSAESNSSTMLYYTLESEGGFSGSSVRRAAGSDYVSGVNTRSNCYAFPLTWSRACGVRINSARFNRIVGWMNERAGWPADEPDQSGWMSLGGATYNNIEALVSGPSALDLLARGTDGSVWRQHWDPSTGYTGWVATGGTAAPQGARTGDIAAVSRRPGQLDLFILGSDGAVWTKAYSGGWPGTPWPAGTGWYSLGGVLVDAPAVASWGRSRIDVFGRGTDDQLWWQFWDGSAWSGWLPLGGPAISGAPAAASWASGRVDVIVRARSDGALVHYACEGACRDPSAWAAPAVLDGAVFPASARPALVTTGRGNLDVLIRGYPGDVWFDRYRDGGWWGWWSLGGAIFDDVGATRRGDLVEMVVTGGDRQIYAGTIYPDGWFGGFAGIGASALGTPSALSLDADSLDVYLRDARNTARTRWWTSGGGWSQ